MEYTVGQLIDKLCIENVRLWMLQDMPESKEVLIKIKKSNKFRCQLIAELDLLSQKKEHVIPSEKSY